MPVDPFVESGKEWGIRIHNGELQMRTTSATRLYLYLLDICLPDTVTPNVAVTSIMELAGGDGSCPQSGYTAWAFQFSLTLALFGADQLAMPNFTDGDKWVTVGTGLSGITDTQIYYVHDITLKEALGAVLHPSASVKIVDPDDQGASRYDLLYGIDTTRRLQEEEPSNRATIRRRQLGVLGGTFKHTVLVPSAGSSQNAR